MYARLHMMKLIALEADESARLRSINQVAKGLSLHAKPMGTCVSLCARAPPLTPPLTTERDRHGWVGVDS